MIPTQIPMHVSDFIVQSLERIKTHLQFIRPRRTQRQILEQESDRLSVLLDVTTEVWRQWYVAAAVETVYAQPQLLVSGRLFRDEIDPVGDMCYLSDYSTAVPGIRAAEDVLGDVACDLGLCA